MLAPPACEINGHHSVSWIIFWATDNYNKLPFKFIKWKRQKWDSSTYKWFYHCRGLWVLLQALCPSDQFGEGRCNSSLPSSTMTVKWWQWHQHPWSAEQCYHGTAQQWTAHSLQRYDLSNFQLPTASAGLPSMTRPILWGITMKKKSSQVFQLFNISLSIGFIIQHQKFNLITKKILPRYIRKTTVIIYPCNYLHIIFRSLLTCRYSLHSCDHGI